MLARVGLALPFALALAAAHVSTASAQGAPAPPPPPPPTGDPVTDAGGGYPASLVDRPLILPSGKLEVAGYFWIPTNDGIDLFEYVTMTVSGRYSMGTLEPFAGAELAVITPDGSNTETLQALFAGVGAAVGPGVARGQITKLGVATDSSWFVLTGRYEYKQKLQPKLALLADAGLEVNMLSSDPDFSANAIYLSVGGAGQAQLSPVVALQGGLRLNVPISSGDNQDPDMFTWNTVTQLYGEGLYNMGKLDLFARLGFTMVEDSTTTAFVVGVLARPM
jgi:hypothetical protein